VNKWLKGKTAIVFGAGGFIGSHLVDELVKGGATHVLAVANYHNTGKVGLVPAHPNCGVVRGDIRDTQFIESVMYKAVNYHCGHPIVFNCAALVSVPYSMQLPEAYLETNLLAVSRMLRVFSHFHCPFVQVSTSEVFDGESHCYYATSRRTPVSPYGATKAMSELLVRGWRALYGPQSVACRLFNTYGPRQSPRAVIPKMILEAMAVKAKRKKQAELGDPDTERSFMYVKDSARALIRAAQWAEIAKDNDEPLLQVCAEKATRISDLWRVVANVVGIDEKNVAWDKGLRKLGIRVSRLAGIRSNWFHDFKESMGLAQGITLAYEWLKANRGYYTESEYQ
jgi:dTDP-glucose 4,6-dehydratase